MRFQEFAYTLRTLWKSPVFSATVIVTIALAIGANTAIFSVMHAVLAQPLPYKDPDRLVLGYGDLRRRNVRDLPLSNADYFDLRNGTKNAFEDFEQYSPAKNFSLRRMERRSRCGGRRSRRIFSA